MFYLHLISFCFHFRILIYKCRKFYDELISERLNFSRVLVIGRGLLLILISKVSYNLTTKSKLQYHAFFFGINAIGVRIAGEDTQFIHIMKKLFFILAASMLLASGCSDEYDDSALTGRVDDLENRVKTLEELCRQMNTNISSLQTLVTALQNSDYITSVTPVTSGGQTIGYTMTFKHALPITIYHGTNGKDGQDGTDGKDGQDGKNGTTPVIGVALYNGVYYWTLNGTWLTDTYGNKIKAEGTDGRDGVDGRPGTDGKPGQDGDDGQDGKPGEDGEDGITPQLKIENEYWYISYDNGASWTQLGKATGDKGDKGDKGDQGIPGASGGDSIFSKVEDGPTEVVFTLADGTTTITIPKYTAAASLDIAFETTESVNVLPGKSYEIGYTLSGADERTVVEVVAQNGYRADVVATDYRSGKIVITAPETAADDRIIVLVNDGSDRTLMRFIHIAESVIRITTDSYTIEADGGTQTVEVETNIDYTVYIAEADRDWVSLAPKTRAAVHTETLNFTFQPNPNTTYRYAMVELRDASGMVGQSILFAQKASGYKTVHVATAGTLDSYISESEKKSLIGLKITGTLNTFDYDFIRNMPALESVDIAQITNTTIPPSCFKASTIRQVILPLHLTAIPDNAFYQSKITSIEIPASVTSIGMSAFYQCSDLTGSLLLPEGLQSIGEKAFYECKKLTGNLHIPDNVTSLGTYAFYFCSGFTGSLTFGTGISIIPDYCFQDCSGFTGNLVIPDQVTKIGVYAFEGCISFRGYLTIGSGVTSIGNFAFTNKINSAVPLHFSKVYCKAATSPNLTTDFSGIAYYQYLAVPIGSSAAYQADAHWIRSFTTIEEVEF